MSTAAVTATSSGNAAYLRLRHAIVRLELPPSAPVSEAHLGDRFGLSKAAVRAALARLRAEGLVLAEPRRGHVIAPLTLRDVREIYDLRLEFQRIFDAGDETTGEADLDMISLGVTVVF